MLRPLLVQQTAPSSIGRRLVEVEGETDVPQEIALYANFTAWENMMFWGGLHNIPKQNLHKKAEELLKLIGLTDRKDEKVKTYFAPIRYHVDKLEQFVDDSVWPLPKFRELLFI